MEETKWFGNDLLNGTVRYGLLVIGALGAVLGMAGDFTESNVFLRSWMLEHVGQVSSGLHIVLIVLVLFPARIRPLSTDLLNPNVRLAAKCINERFLVAWRAIWVAFGFLYVLILFTQMEPHLFKRIDWGGQVLGHAYLVDTLRDLADLGSTGAILLCAYFLGPGFIRRYYRNRAEHDPGGAQRATGTSGKRRNAEGTSRTWTPIVIGTIVAGLFGAGLVLRWYAVVGSWEYGLRSFDLLLGMLSAVSLGMLAARLDSPFIGNWQWVIVLLFLYGSMQVFSQAYTGLTLTSNPVLVYTAFSLKCVWFLFVSDQFANKRILYYAYESLRPELEKSV